MIASTMLALIFIGTQPEMQVVPVDRCEINSVAKCNGGDFTQVVLWRWSHSKKRFIVAEWQMLPFGWHRETRGVIRWRDQDGRIYRVKPLVFIETSGADTEIEDRKLVPECNRWPYFDR